MAEKGGGILRNTFTVGAFTALSRVLGLVREMLQSRLIGAGVEQSAFTLAFAIPNMARKLFGEGALTAAFVPIFKGEVESGDFGRAARLARAVMTTVLLTLAAAVFLCMGGLEAVVAYRRELGLMDAPRLKLTVRLVKEMLPYMIFICGAAFGMGVLNSLGRFKAAGFMPSILNVCWIAVLGWISFFPDMAIDRRIHRIAIAIVVAGALQMAFLFWRMAEAGVSPRPAFSGWRDPKVVLVWKNLGLAAVGAGAVQINYMLDQLLAQLANEWAAGVIGYAERLMDLPLGVVGVAFGTVLLPTFAGRFAKGDVDGVREAFSSSLKSMLFVMLPAAVGLHVLSQEITSVIYQGRAFDATATLRVSRALAVYAAGLGFFGVQKMLVPWFQAQKDMKTPLRVSLVTVALNVTLNVLAVTCLPSEWRHVGLAWSTVVCAVTGCALLVALAIRRNGSLGLSGCVAPVAKMLAASFAMGVVVYVSRPFVVASCDACLPEVPARIASLAVMVAAGGVAYAAAALALMRGEARTLLRRRSAKREPGEVG